VDANPVTTDYTEQALRALKEGDKDTSKAALAMCLNIIWMQL